MYFSKWAYSNNNVTSCKNKQHLRNKYCRYTRAGQLVSIFFSVLRSTRVLSQLTPSTIFVMSTIQHQKQSVVNFHQLITK